MLRVLVAAGFLGVLALCQATQASAAVEDDWRACQLEGEGRPHQAELVYSACTRVIEQGDDPDLIPGAYNNRSLVLLYWRRSGEAIADLDKAIELRPGQSTYHNNRGRAHSQRGNAEMAAADFQEAIRLNPDNEWAHNNYAWHLAELGDYAAAWPHAEKAVALDPESYLFLDTWAHVLMGLGKAEEAEAAFAKAIDFGADYLLISYQEALAKKGYDPGRDDGVMDDATQAALAACIRDNCRLLLD